MKNFILKYVFVNSDQRDQRNEYSCKLDFSPSSLLSKKSFLRRKLRRTQSENLRNCNVRWLDYFGVVSHQNEHGTIMTADDDRLHASCNRAQSEFKYAVHVSTGRMRGWTTQERNSAAKGRCTPGMAVIKINSLSRNEDRASSRTGAL